MGRDRFRQSHFRWAEQDRIQLLGGGAGMGRHAPE